MRPIVAAVVLVGMCAGDDSPPGAPENDWRIAKVTVGQPQKIGILTYYPNLGGGYTFLEHGNIVFYALPLLPTTYHIDRSVLVTETRKGIVMQRHIVEAVSVDSIGKETVPFGGQTIYRYEMKEISSRVHCRLDIPIAKWTRDASDGKFRLSIMEGDRETRLKLKSIVFVLEHARNPFSKP
jgi:hypothetical protein